MNKFIIQRWMVLNGKKQTRRPNFVALGARVRCLGVARLQQLCVDMWPCVSSCKLAQAQALGLNPTCIDLPVSINPRDKQLLKSKSKF
jgi:hypothetical protein